MLKKQDYQEDDGDSKKGFNNMGRDIFLKIILANNVKDM